MRHLRTIGIGVVLAGTMGIAGAQIAPQKGTEPMQITPAQRTEIYQTVIKDTSKVRKPPPAESQVTVGTELPGSIELHTLPDSIMMGIPAAKQYRYTIWNNQVVIVDPTNLKVVALIRE
jgi:hypothetical protein